MRALLLLLAACSGEPDEAPAAQPPRLVGGEAETSDPRDDTRVPDEEDTDRAVTEDTWTYLDPAIGRTALDGVWTGTFELTEVVIATENPKCAGVATFTIDGDGPRHVIAQFSCTTWDPNISLLPGGLGRDYGELFGVGFASLTASDLSKFRMDLAMAADAMITFNAEGVLVKDEGGALVIDWEDVVGVLGIRTGHKLSASLTRAP
ncbi:MAG TPA: hypothetical protein PKA64_11190 [Myxococcota bacterium]|nr:hypothetical protein [Myxococcota bacterium]